MPDPDLAESISGRATGVLFFAGFGSLWLCTGLASCHRLGAVTGAGIALVLILLAVPAVLLLRRTARLRAPDEPGTGSDSAPLESAEQARIRRVFGRVNAAQWIAIFLAVALLNLLHHPEYIVPAVATIVGLHLFPLARLFRYPLHHLTGAALVLWSASVVLFLPRSGLASYGALGTAAILLLSAGYTLRSAQRAFRGLSGRNP